MVKGTPQKAVRKSKRSTPNPSPTTNVAHVLPLPKGWQTQTCQLGGVPAIAVYRKGRLKRVTALQTPDGIAKRHPAPKTALQRLPTRSTRTDTHAVIGQLRNGVFEALAVSTLTGRTLLSLVSFTSLYDTPSSRCTILPGATATVSKNAPRIATSISVVSTLYRNRLLLHWFDREKGKRLFTMRLRRRASHPIYAPPKDTRPSKG